MAREATVRRRRGGAQSSGSGTPVTARGNSNDEAARQQPEQPDIKAALRQLFIRSALMYAMYHYYLKKPSESEPGTEVTTSSSSGSPAVATVTGMMGLSSQKSPKYYQYKLKTKWIPGQDVAFRVFVSGNPDMSFREAKERGRDDAIWADEGVKYATVAESYLAANVSMQVPEDVRQRNATWYAHVFVARGNMWDTETVSDEMIEKAVLYARHDIIKWLKVDLKKKGKNLLGVDNDDESSEDETDPTTYIASSEKPKDEAKVSDTGDESNTEGEETVRYDQVWKPTMPIQLVMASGPLILGQLPPAAAEMYRVDEENRLYYPPMHVSQFWMLRDSLHLMNDTVKDITVEMSFSPIGLYKWTMYKQFDSIWQKQVDFGAMQPDEPDELKRMFIETNPVLLGTTMIVSLAHSVLEMLAFKNDISHWKNIKSMEGVSVRSMIWKIVMEAIIFLYLWDNDTSWMITVGNGIGVGIAMWKLGKAVKFENFGKRKLFGFIPWFDMTDRESYSKETKEYDDQAMKYLGYALYPLVLTYALYSLRYERHKSWYSWVINSLVGAVYAFGFIMMFPQIFINYKLKSVAHMPMKAMMYKTLNTVIDDLFSFIIKMPWLHRLACFRDDIVFLILLYQRWIYPVDSKRVNEFGQQFDEDGTEKAPVTEAPVTDGDAPVTAAGTGDENEAVVAEGEEKDSEEKKND